MGEENCVVVLWRPTRDNPAGPVPISISIEVDGQCYRTPSPGTPTHVMVVSLSPIRLLLPSGSEVFGSWWSFIMSLILNSEIISFAKMTANHLNFSVSIAPWWSSPSRYHHCFKICIGVLHYNSVLLASIFSVCVPKGASGRVPFSYEGQELHIKEYIVPDKICFLR